MLENKLQRYTEMYELKYKELGDSKTRIAEFLDKVETATPFHSYEWLSAIEKHLNTKCRIAEFYKGNTCVGICPLFEKKLSMLKVNFSPLLATETAYMGILSNENILPLLKDLKKEVKNFFMILPPGLDLKGTGESVEECETVITNLDQGSAEAHLKIMKKGHRYNIRKAQKEGVEIIEDYSEKAITDYHSLLTATYKSITYNPLPLSFYIDIIQNLHSQNKIKFYLAKYKGKIIGGAVFPILKDGIYYMSGGSLKLDYSRYYPNDLIQWNVIQYGYEQNFKKYDMLGASIEGIKKFKLGFGGYRQPYYRLYSSKKLRFLASVYNKLGHSIKGSLRSKMR